MGTDRIHRSQIAIHTSEHDLNGVSSEYVTERHDLGLTLFQFACTSNECGFPPEEGCYLFEHGYIITRSPRDEVLKIAKTRRTRFLAIAIPALLVWLAWIAPMAVGDRWNAFGAPAETGSTS